MALLTSPDTRKGHYRSGHLVMKRDANPVSETYFTNNGPTCPRLLYYMTDILTYLLHGAESFLRS